MFCTTGLSQLHRMMYTEIHFRALLLKQSEMVLEHLT